ncbi:jg25251, partial [Pararge aegeria aegeria]
ENQLWNLLLVEIGRNGIVKNPISTLWKPLKEAVMSQRKAARTYHVPRQTLVNHLKSGKVEKQIGRRTVLTAEQKK